MMSSIALLAAGSAVACGPLERHDPVWVTIPHGASVEEIAESLAVHDLVGSSGSFTWYTRFRGVSDSLRPGSYRLHPGMSPFEIVDELLEGSPFTSSLYLPAGLWVDEVAHYVERQLDIPADSFLAAAADSTFTNMVGAPGATVEGYLAPGEYRVRRGASASEVIGVILAEFERRWLPSWDRRLVALGMSRAELVTLASIVEGEGGAPDEARRIASVYHNRLSRGMRLQADPTVVYGLRRRRRLYNRDYDLASPYNTYRVEGLPPSPIGNPSRASLEAALYPADTDFLFLVARPGGEHVFSRTYAEHLEAIRAVRRGYEGPGD